MKREILVLFAALLIYTAGAQTTARESVTFDSLTTSDSTQRTESDIQAAEAQNIEIAQLKQSLKVERRNELILALIFILTLTVILLANINYRRKREERLLKIDKALRNELKEKLKIYNIISGELREPLNDLYKVANLLRGDKETFPPVQAEKLLERSKQTFARSELVLLNLFTWTTLRSHQLGELKRTKKHINLRQLTTLTAQKAVFSYTEKGIEFVNDIDKGIELEADEAALSLLLWNLIDNALKFSIKDSPIRISAREKNKVLEVSIKDKGTGMSREFAYDFELSSYDEYTSQGLGLQVCKLLATTYHGDIWFESEPGSGTTAYFTIPR